MNILLLSAYDAASHRYWHRGLVEHFPEYSWQLLSLPGRYFNWRIRGNPLSWHRLNHQELNQTFDLIVATSMVDLATLKGLVPQLAMIPSLVYFHENQFAYPPNQSKQNCAEPKMVNLYSALCADKILFNSTYNRDSFLHGVTTFLKKMPDFVPSQLVPELANKSLIAPVPLDNSLFLVNHQKKGEDIQLLWNHRWEYDKGPERLNALLERLTQTPISFKIHIVGEGFRDAPEIFERIHKQFKNYIGEWGYLADKQQYYQLLQQSHFALSTAIHEFQGLAVMEAVSQGCIPIVPDRLSYQEIFPPGYRYKCSENIENEAQAMCDLILEKVQYGTQESCLNMQQYSWQEQKAVYQSIIEAVVKNKK